jgi:hypothetical protein
MGLGPRPWCGTAWVLTSRSDPPRLVLPVQVELGHGWGRDGAVGVHGELGGGLPARRTRMAIQRPRLEGCIVGYGLPGGRQPKAAANELL